METTGLSLGKSVLDGALGYAKSAITEEVALQLGVQRDQAFIRDELEMMQAFLMAAHEERDEHKVIKTWVKQVRDVAYAVEDNLQDFTVRLGKPSWWCIPRVLLDRHRVAMQMKELRAKVEDVSQRNVRYRLIKGSGPNLDTIAEKFSMASATMSGTEEVRRQQYKAKINLIGLINMRDEDLKVTAVWGTSGVLGEISVVKRAYDDLKRDKKFECEAWIKIMRPFSPKMFLQNIVRQFYVDSLEETTNSTPGAQVLRSMGVMKEGDLVDAFKKYLNGKRYLIVLNDISTIEEWEQISTCFPGNNKKGCRLIVCTEQVEVASLCVGPKTVPPEHKQLSDDKTLYAFYEKGSEDGMGSMISASRSNTADSTNDSCGKRLTRAETMVAALKESKLIGRENEKSEIIKLISNNCVQELDVISICGMGGLGKTTLVKDIYQSQELSAMFEKRACVTIKHPFNPLELISSLAVQLDEASSKNKETLYGDRTKLVAQSALASCLEGKKYLIVLDDLSSTTEWDAIIEYFPRTNIASRIIVTTRVQNIAKHCSKKEENIYMLKNLGDQDALDLFTEKVFDNFTDLEKQYPELVEEAKLILSKCNGLPLAIVTIGGFLAKQPKTPTEWRKLNEHINAELEMNPEIGKIKNVLIKSYDGLPYHLKSCFLYLSIFPKDYKVGRRRLVQRWIAEGYSREICGKSAEEIANNYFMELIDRKMIIPSQRYIYISKGIDSCQVHDLMHEIAISKSAEENLVFRLEEGYSSNTQGIVRHLAISSNWKGDKSEFESIVDLSHIRSLTVFGKWRPFFISSKMRLLRILDLEGTSDLLNHHLENIGNLVHLMFLSLRRCEGIFYLPDSLGNLQQLQTLDTTYTRIAKLPRAIINLRKLQYVRSGSYEGFVEDKQKVVRNRLCPSTLISLGLGPCVAYWSPQLMKDAEKINSDLNSQEACTYSCMFPFLAKQLNPQGVVVPRGIMRLKALRTLGIVNISGGSGILHDIKKLTGLRKLAVTGINKKNCQDFCSTLADLRCLESLSVQSMGEPGLNGCLDGVSVLPKHLQSLQLYGNLVKLPEWIKELPNLVKLKLWNTSLSELNATIEVIGKLPNLKILSLWQMSFQGEELCLSFQQGAFPSLKVLELHRLHNLKSVEFEEAATPKLEFLQFRGLPRETNPGLFSGISSLRSLEEFTLKNDDYKESFVEDLRDQLNSNANGPVLKRI